MADYLKGIPMISAICDKIIKQLDDLGPAELSDDPEEAELALWRSFVELEEARDET